jgi:Domain of unknown function (DUF4278)
MQLFYRGTTFNYDPAERAASRLAQRTVESPYELTYRGHTYQINPTVTPETSVKPVAYELNYRGTAYQVHRDEQGKITAIASSANASKHKILSSQQASENCLS